MINNIVTKWIESGHKIYTKTPPPQDKIYPGRIYFQGITRKGGRAFF